MTSSPRRMARGESAACVLALSLGLALAADETASQVLPFTRDEIASILQHGPWPPQRERDASNRVSGDALAALFGRQLFFDTRLSLNGALSCTTCHIPEKGWSDGRARATGIADLHRNTKSVANARFNRWFGWSGASDSLWAASLRPMLEPAEMGSAERHVAMQIRTAADLGCAYRATFGPIAEAGDEALFANIGKALAAFQETLVTGRTPFDDFRDSLARNDREGAARYPLAAQRGLRIFIGKGACNVCHIGPHFTNGEFDKVGIPVRTAYGHFDWGRYDGIKALHASRFNLLSGHNDNAAHATLASTRYVKLSPASYGAFKVPGLRNVALTAPYMHNGSMPTLESVVRHYSEIDAVKLHVAASHPHAEIGEELSSRPQENVLRTLNLTDSEIADLVKFLESLTEHKPSAPPHAAKVLRCF